MDLYFTLRIEIKRVGRRWRERRWVILRIRPSYVGGWKEKTRRSRMKFFFFWGVGITTVVRVQSSMVRVRTTWRATRRRDRPGEEWKGTGRWTSCVGIGRCRRPKHSGPPICYTSQGKFFFKCSYFKPCFHLYVNLTRLFCGLWSQNR